jgi:hypothetical protein
MMLGGQQKSSLEIKHTAHAYKRSSDNLPNMRVPGPTTSAGRPSPEIDIDPYGI